MLKEAIQWIHQNHLNGQAIAIADKKRIPYPEVTGYYIPTLLSIGEIELAKNFARWLVTVQNRNGSFSLDDPATAYVFDTGQVIRGWVAIIERMPELAEPLMRACDWIIQTADPITARLLCPAPNGAWSLGKRGEINEGIHLYVLKPLQDAGRILNRPDIIEFANRSRDYYLNNVSLTDFAQPNALTHFYAYIQEALVELDCIDLARNGMASMERYQKQNGAIPAYFNVNWVCSTGLAQLAKVWIMLNEPQKAAKILTLLSHLQNASGGFYGSYGVFPEYFPTLEIAWAVKYTIDAMQLWIKQHFDNTVHHYQPNISIQDGRVQALFSQLNDTNCILDAGCGKGRYANLIKQCYPHMDVHAIDVSDEMLKHVPNNIVTRQASIQSIPYPDHYFDTVYCVETLEHATNASAAIAEMTRVLKPGGTLIIIDKNQEKQGALQIEFWENWFDVNTLKQIMNHHGINTEAGFTSYDNRPADGLFVIWYGKKTACVHEHTKQTMMN